MQDDSLPGSHQIIDFADFDTRFYKAVQLYEPENAKPGEDRDRVKELLTADHFGTGKQPDFVIMAGFTPADDRDYDDWYRKEHLKEISGITGWRRTSRYELSTAVTVTDSPKYLTLVRGPVLCSFALASMAC
jgi:hypothetical protein